MSVSNQQSPSCRSVGSSCPPKKRPALGALQGSKGKRRSVYYLSPEKSQDPRVRAFIVKLAEMVGKMIPENGGALSWKKIYQAQIPPKEDDIQKLNDLFTKIPLEDRQFSENPQRIIWPVNCFRSWGAIDKIKEVVDSKIKKECPTRDRLRGALTRDVIQCLFEKYKGFVSERELEPEEELREDSTESEEKVWRKSLNFGDLDSVLINNKRV